MRILFLDLDTLRPDHLGCYGYHRNTSPNLDAIAAQGVRFEQYYCSDAPCLPSRAALMSGRFGMHSGVVGHGGTAADMRLEGPARGFRDRMYRESLPALLRRAGMHTCTISPFADRHAAWWFYAGFNEVHDDAGMGGLESAEHVTPSVLRWIEGNAAREDWFLHVNYWDPHTPYRAPEAFGNPFADDPLPAWLTPAVLEDHRRMAGPHGAREISMYHNKPWDAYPRHLGEIADMADLRTFIDGYDTGIRYMDDHLGRLFTALADQGALDDLAIIISADHGENMGELGIYGEHATADVATCRIPMILRWPGCAAGHVDDGLHYNLDLAPTLAALLEQPAPPGWDGVSYAPALQGDPCGREALILSQCAHVCQRSVRFDDWLYLRTYHDGYHLWPQEMLFHVVDDPHQQHDRAAARPDLCREGAHCLLDWHDAMMATNQDAVDPLWTVMHEGGPFHARGHLTEYCAYLEATDRAWAAEELRKRHPGE